MTATDIFPITLLKWYAVNGRALPWRETKDPYAIWLSEVILQQTRIEQGGPYWERFMRRWPTVKDLAAATEDEVLREWQGLGYYSRARHLHEAARQIVAQGTFPQTLQEIRSLKGVGDYTAAAIASFAYDMPAAVVDGNVYRVLSRYFDIEVPINSTEGVKLFKALAQSLLPEGAPAAYNQAIMDFGAVLCTPSSPQCLTCPLMDSCMALRNGTVEQRPVKKKTLKVRERHLIYLYLRCNGETAIRRRGAGDIWQGLWEPVLVCDDDRCCLDNTVANHLLQQSILVKKDFKHVLTHRVLLTDFYLLKTDERPPLPSDYRWIPEDTLDTFAKPRLIELLLADQSGTELK